MSKSIKFQVTVKVKKRRALELFHPDSPFWPKVAKTHKKHASRHPKHRKGGDE